MRASGAAIGAQIAAAIVSAHPGTGDGYTIAFAMAAILLAAALVPTLILTRRRTPRAGDDRRRPTRRGLRARAGVTARHVAGLDARAGERDVERVVDPPRTR